MAGQPIDGVLDANDRAHGFHLSSESFLCACIPYLAIYFNVLCDILAGFVPLIKDKLIGFVCVFLCVSVAKKIKWPRTRTNPHGRKILK